MNTAEESAPLKIVDPLHRVSLVDGVTTAVIDCANEFSVNTLNIAIKINFVLFIFSFSPYQH
jgi:hypothetical protein